MSTHEAADWTPSTNEAKAAVWEQVDRMLTDPSFSRSKRYPSLLRFIVAKTLDGESECLKERVLGIEVFGRQPDYDSTRDPIVRVTVAEIRKRMLQYYDDPQHRNELRLSLPSGSYIPQFSTSSDGGERPGAGPESPETGSSRHFGVSPVPGLPPIAADEHLVAPKRLRRPVGLWALAVLAVALMLTVAIVLGRSEKQGAFDAFWAPAFHASSPILICINDQPLTSAPLMDAANPVTIRNVTNKPQMMNAGNVPLIVDLTRMLAEHGRSSKVQSQSRTTFEDLRGGPLVLLGAYNNYWTLKMTAPLRFHFANNAEMNHFWIEDRRDPQNRDWSTEDKPGVRAGKDYALLARFVSSSTGQPTYVIAGLRHISMAEGVKLLLSPQLLAKMATIDAAGKQYKNVEIVIETDIIDGSAGPPSVMAVYTW